MQCGKESFCQFYAGCVTGGHGSGKFADLSERMQENLERERSLCSQIILLYRLAVEAQVRL